MDGVQQHWISAFGSLSIFMNLTIALSLGMMIGIERQVRQRHTGLNTHALVSLGAAAFTSLAGLMPGEVNVRMGAQVVTGIGFLGAGLIMRDGLNVRGLAGAATIWATGAVGTLAGYGFILEAVETTAFVLLVNLAAPRLSRLVDRLAPDDDLSDCYYIIELKCAARDEAAVRARLLHAINENQLRLQSLESHALKPPGAVEVEAIIYSTHKVDLAVEQMVGALSLSPDIFSARWSSSAAPE